MNKIKAYIASPYTNGWQASNVRLQLEAKHIMMDHGFVPFAPLTNHFEEIFRHRPEKEWYEWDLEWLALCDILIRIRPLDKNNVEIPSTGADGEEKLSREMNIPVFTFKDTNELNDWCIKNKDLNVYEYE